MGVNVVQIGDTIELDLTNDSVTPETLAEGVTAHDKSGAIIVGTMKSGGDEDLNVVLTEQESLIAELKTLLQEKASGDTVLTRLLQETVFSDENVTQINDELFRGWQYITKINLPNVTKTVNASYLCYGCTKLEEVYMPKCTTLGTYAFYNTALKSIDFPSLTAVPANCFRQCTSATTVKLPVCTSIAGNAFQKDALIEKMDFPMVASIAATAFDQCSALTVVILRVGKVCTLVNVSAFTNTPIASGNGFIYVPKSLESTYKSASNWSTYSTQIRAIEDYPDICGG